MGSTTEGPGSGGEFDSIPFIPALGIPGALFTQRHMPFSLQQDIFSDLLAITFVASKPGYGKAFWAKPLEHMAILCLSEKKGL